MGNLNQQPRGMAGTMAAMLLSVLGLSACSSAMEPKVYIDKLEEDSVISGTPSLRQTYISKLDSEMFICSEAMPDSGFDYAQGGSFGINFLNFGGGKDAMGETATSKELELTGRTPGVLQTRELFYRLCEFDRNHKLDNDTAIELYKRNLDIVEQIVNTEAGNTNVTVGDNVTTSVTLTDTSSESATDKAPEVGGDGPGNGGPGGDGPGDSSDY